jgi:hypothetical protein
VKQAAARVYLQGPMLRQKKISSPKNGVFCSKYCKNWIITLVLKKGANFFAKNSGKSRRFFPSFSLANFMLKTPTKVNFTTTIFFQHWPKIFAIFLKANVLIILSVFVCNLQLKALFYTPHFGENTSKNNSIDI